MRPPISPSSNTAFINLGSNIEPHHNLAAAGRALALRFVGVRGSSVYASPAVGGPTDAPGFLNAALCFETDLEPYELKYEVLRPLEAELGRIRTEDRFAPRTIDLDIALLGQIVLDDPDRGLTIPDPDLHRFAHVAVPLAELAPDRTDPVSGATLLEIADRVPGRDALTKIALSADSPFRTPRDRSASPSPDQESSR